MLEKKQKQGLLMDRYKVVERIETPPIAALNLKKYLAHDLKS